MTTSEHALPKQIIEQAIAWRTVIESQERHQDIQACKLWRDSDPRHEAAWQRLLKLDCDLHRLSEDCPRLIHDTLIQANQEQITLSRRQAFKWLSGSAMSMLLLTGVTHYSGALDRFRADYSTGLGERHPFRLADDSQVWLNGNSALQVDFSPELRRLSLLRGEMVLECTPSETPMKLLFDQGEAETSDAKVVVRSDGERPLLQVVKGAVHIRSRDSLQYQNLTAGEGVLFTGAAQQPLNAREFDYASWTQGAFQARNMPLPDFIAELSRFRHGVIDVDKRLTKVLVSGVFQLKDTDVILEILARSSKAKLNYFTRWYARLS